MKSKHSKHDSKHLPPIELKHFDRNPAYLPKFIESFISKIQNIHGEIVKCSGS